MSLQRAFQLHRMGVPMDIAMEDSVLWKGGDKQKTTSTPAQSAQYGTLLQGADQWLKDGGLDKTYGGSYVSDPVADLTADQQAAISGLSSTGQNLQSMYNGLGQSSLSNFLGSYDPSKTGLSSAIDASNNQLDYNYNTTVAPQIRQGAQETGQFGSTRHGVAEGIAQSNLAQAKTNAASTLAYQDQQSYNQNQLAALNNLSNITTGLNSGNTAQYNAGALQQSQNQSEIQGQLEKWAYENNVDLNTLAAYQSLISGDMGGTTTSTGGAKGSGIGSAIGTVGGAIAGFYLGGPAGAMAGASAGGQLGSQI